MKRSDTRQRETRREITVAREASNKKSDARQRETRRERTVVREASNQNETRDGEKRYYIHDRETLLCARRRKVVLFAAERCDVVVNS